MIFGAVNLLKGVWDWTGRVLGGVGDWLRKEHDWWRIGCFGLAFVCLVSSFAVYERHRAVITVKTECSLAGRICLAEKAILDARAATALGELALIQRTLELEQARLADLQERNAMLKGENARLHRVATDTYQAWLQTNENRAPQCSILLAQLAAECPELEDY